MCHESIIEFCKRNIIIEEVTGKRVLEVGSMNINGSIRPIVESFGSSQYIGIDYRQGDGVDIVCNAENIVERFGKESFDIIISTSFLEHVNNWKSVINNMKIACKKGGIMIHTTVSKGYGLHEYPGDYWRYEAEDMINIFSDFDILALEKDPQVQGIFVKARKRLGDMVKDLSGYKLYNINSNKRE